jgi:hypothetical protein
MSTLHAIADLISVPVVYGSLLHLSTVTPWPLPRPQEHGGPADRDDPAPRCNGFPARRLSQAYTSGRRFEIRGHVTERSERSRRGPDADLLESRSG